MNEPHKKVKVVFIERSIQTVISYRSVIDVIS